MATQAVALMVTVIVAYYIVAYRRQLAFLVAVVIISILLFGAVSVALLFHGEPFGNELVNRQSTSQQN